MDNCSNQSQISQEESTKNINSDSTKEQIKQDQNQQLKQNIQVDSEGLGIISTKMERITRDYTLLDSSLGYSQCSQIRKGIHLKTGKMWAVKSINKSQTSKEQQEKLMNEMNLLKKFDHPNIMKIFESFQDDKFFYIVMELCSGGELYEKIQKEGNFSEKKAAEIFKQILSVVNYCHQQNIVLRDIKPEKILFESEDENSLLKFFDFRTSIEFTVNQKLNQKIGTPFYIAPEVLNNNYDEKCDIWSCGVILYILLYGYPPFSGQSEKRIIEKVKKGTYSFESDGQEDISNEAKEYIKRLLQFDPTKRCSAQEALQDPWIKKFTNVPEVEQSSMKKALTNMKNFRKLQNLSEAWFKDVIYQLTTQEEKQELLIIFHQLDTKNNGKLSKQDLLMGYQMIMNADLALEVVDTVLSQVDKNNTGMINYTDFVITTINREEVLSKQRLQSIFKQFDVDKSSTIGFDEFQQLFGAISEEMWKQVVQEVGQNQDGQISVEVFLEMMKKTK